MAFQDGNLGFYECNRMPSGLCNAPATLQSKKNDKDQESIQSSTTPDPGYKWESDSFTTRHHKRGPRG